MNNTESSKIDKKNFQQTILDDAFIFYGNFFKYILIYTSVWLCLAIFIIGIFKINGKSFLWLNDGVFQHFISFDYLCDYLKSLFVEHKFAPFFNYTIGQGADILTTLNSYDFTDPVSIIAALFFPLNRVGRYTLMIFIKLYLVGLSFSLYCYAVDCKKLLAVLAGAITYTFSGVILFTFARHPNFSNWAYFLPFILAGIELYLRRGKRIPLVIIVFWSVITNYYTFYMNAILAVIYVFVISLWNIVRNKTFTAFYTEIKKWFLIAGLFCIGILLSMCILLPTIYAYIINARVMGATGYTASAWYYPPAYYTKLIESIFAAYFTSGYYTFLGLNVIMTIPLVLLFLHPKKEPALKSLICISMIMLCIPMAGRLMNGFGYAANRWSYVISFYASVAFVIVFSQMRTMTSREKCYVLMITATYILYCLFDVKTNSNVQKYSALLMLAWVVIMVSVALHYKICRFESFTIGLVIVGACFQIYFTFSSDTGNYVNTFCDTDEITKTLKNYSATAAPTTFDNDFYRVEQYEIRNNVEGYNNVNGTSLWWSLIPSYISEFHEELSLNTLNQNCNIQGLDGRTALLELASVKYYTRPTTKSGLIPYGYKEIASSNTNYQVFENQYALPVGYTYSSYMTCEEYDNLNGLEKEQAMLQGIMLDGPLKEFEHADIEISNMLLDYKISKTAKVTLGDNSIKVNDKNGSIDLVTVVPEDCEVYVYLKGIELLGKTSSVNVTVDRKNNDYYVSKTSRISNLNYNWPVIRGSVAYNLGYGHEGENTITLKFGSKANFSIEEIQIVAVPMSSYISHVTNLSEYSLENIKVGNDTVTGNISLPENRILQLSIPYSIGWKAYVDGEETSILKSNVMYMAIPLSVGEHTIELYYTTPYLRQGILITVITLVVWIGYEVVSRKKAMHKKKG